MSPALEHRFGVDMAAFSADGKLVFTVSHDDRAQVWDATTGKPIGRAYEHGRLDRFVRSEGTVVTEAVVQDARTRIPGAGALEDRGWVATAAFSVDGGTVVTASRNKQAWVWGWTEQMIRPLEHQDRVAAVALSADGTRVLTASWDATARVWDAATGAPITESLRHQGRVTMAAFSGDDRRVVTASDDGTARVWDATTGRQETAPLEHRGNVTVAAFSTDGTRVVTASEDGTARVWDATTGKPVTAPLEHRGIVTAAAFSADGTRIVTASEDQTARVWPLSMHMGSVADWQLLARCSPFVFSNGVVIANPYPIRVCNAIANTTAPR